MPNKRKNLKYCSPKRKKLKKSSNWLHKSIVKEAIDDLKCELVEKNNNLSK